MHTTLRARLSAICCAAAICWTTAGGAAAQQEAASPTDPLHRLPLVHGALEQVGVPMLPVEVSSRLASTLPDTQGLPPRLLPPQYRSSALIQTEANQTETIQTEASQTAPATISRREEVLIWRIWRRLLLSGLQSESAPAILKPWLELLDILRNPAQTDSGRLASLAQWKQSQAREHPAQFVVRHMERLLRGLRTDKKQRIAVVLPQTGDLKPAGDLIATGIRIAWFQLRAQRLQNNNPAPLPELLFLDATVPVNQLVNTVLSESIDLVIGPLDKERVVNFVNTMRIHANHPGTLLLNRLDADEGEISGAISAERRRRDFWQFGLPVEEEIASLLHFARSRGLERAGALMIDTQAGLRAGNALEDLWLELGGEWIGTEIVSGQGELTEAGRDLLLMDSSDRRGQLVQRIINRRLESIPRPRQDLDVLFIAAPGNRGLEVTAALAYNYLKEVPLYSLSSIYQPQRLVNEFDLEGVRFMDMPWMVEAVSQLGYDEQFADRQYRHRLLAFGIDAFNLALRIERGAIDQRLPHWGVTGLLSSNDRQQIEWKPVPVIIRKGLPQLLTP